jgi:hypothetical protein
MRRAEVLSPLVTACHRRWAPFVPGAIPLLSPSPSSAYKEPSRCRIARAPRHPLFHWRRPPFFPAAAAQHRPSVLPLPAHRRLSCPPARRSLGGRARCSSSIGAAPPCRHVRLASHRSRWPRSANNQSRETPNTGSSRHPLSHDLPGMTPHHRPLVIGRAIAAPAAMATALVPHSVRNRKEPAHTTWARS